MNPWLHRFGLLLATLGLAVIISGAWITSTEVVSRLSQSPLQSMVDGDLHRLIAIVLTLLTLVLAVWMSRLAAPRWLRVVAWTGVVTLAASAAFGWSGPPLSPATGVVHALLAHLFFSIMVVIAVGTSASWNRERELIDSGGRPWLRPLAVATPPIIFLQITLGASYRHDVTSIMPHMGFALGVVLLALVDSTVILQNFRRPAILRSAAASMISVVLAQLALGIAAFLLLILNNTGTYFVLATVAHVSLGAATLATSIVLAMQICRSLPSSGLSQ
jgi:heme A synthase